ncbi:endonuclease MutS2 [Kamptonema cortianum]|nr:endonuclease MutS2 [Geitlerinema splendidum]MDK3157655.1 endonuclease MutS2 [Kamptonema cortianum]
MNHALLVLEWTAIQELLANECETPLAQELAAKLEPVFDAESVWENQTRTAEAWIIHQSGLPSLGGIQDLREPLRLAAKGATLDGEKLAQTGRALRIMGAASTALARHRADAPTLCNWALNLPNLSHLQSDLERSLDLDGEVRDEASHELAALRKEVSRSSERILNRIQEYTTGKSRELLSDATFTQRNGRFVIPLKAENRGKIKGIVHDSSATGQTVFIEPQDVVALGNKLREAESAERAEVARILKKLSDEVGVHAKEIITGIETAAELDLIFAKVRLGAKTGSCLPQRDEQPSIEFSAGFHPLLDRSSAIPLTFSLGKTEDVILITGPNTGGKTVAIKTVGLFVCMAQAGMMLPANEAKIGCFTQVWADIGDEQSLQQSLSTFSGHIKNIGTALSHLKPGALVLFDEIGAGTDPDEGAALARALLQEFQAKGAKILASTHYGELKLFASNQPRFVNASMEFDLKTLKPTYRYLPGTPGSSHAFKIAQRYGIPQHVIDSALVGFSEQEQDLARMIEQLEVAQKRAQKAQSEADRLAARLRKVEIEAEEKLRQAEEARKRTNERAASELDEVLRQIRIEAAEIFEELKRNPTQEGIATSRAKIKELQEAGSALSRDIRPRESAKESSSTLLTKGCKVKIRDLNMTGILLDNPKGKKVAVQAGSMKMDVEVAKLVLLEAPTQPQKTKTKRNSASLRLQGVQSIASEIHLRELRAEEAQERLERFLDEAVLAGVSSIRIVHGKGEGVLRKLTHDCLRRSPSIVSYQSASADQGGDGVTIAFLE